MAETKGQKEPELRGVYRAMERVAGALWPEDGDDLPPVGGASFGVLRADSDGGRPRFRAVAARRNVVDRRGLLLQPLGAREQDGDSTYLLRQHPQLRNQPPISLGAGKIYVTPEVAYVDGTLHDTATAREFAEEALGLQEWGLGASSAHAVPTSREAIRTGRQLTAEERQLGAKEVWDTWMVRDMSFVDYGAMPQSDFSLMREHGALDNESGEGETEGDSEASGRTAVQEAALARLRERADSVDRTLARAKEMGNG